jgi:stromal membrane-associated protein
MGAFCCLECSGSHRRLGVHISFVRSINLDSWKEKEVMSMENGGNAKVNAVFEANLARSGAAKPTNLADGPTRERFIRDKYERRKYYDAAAFGNLPTPSPTANRTSTSAPSSAVGPPSEAARQRMEARRLKKSQSADTADTQSHAIANTAPPKRATSSVGTSRGTRRPVKHPTAPAPSSAPIQMDLLDLLSDPAPTHAPAPSSNNFNASFHESFVVDTSGNSNTTDLFDFNPQPPSGRSTESSRNRSRSPPPRSRSKEGKPNNPRTTSSQDILSLYGPSSSSSQQQPQTSNVVNNRQSMNGMQGNNSSFNNMNPQSNSMGMIGGTNCGAANPNIMGVTNNGNNNHISNMTAMMGSMNFQNGNNMQSQQHQQMTPQQVMMYQQQMMMQQQQQRMMMMQQQQQNQQQNSRNGMGNPMMMASQQSNSNGNPMMGHAQGFGAQNSTANYGNSNQDAFGGMAPMGSGPPVSSMNSYNSSQPNVNASAPEKEDPFASFGMNAFRS